MASFPVHVSASSLSSSSASVISTESVTTATAGIALDVDGVLVRDATVIEQAIPALQILQSHKKTILTVFVTNGGSITEEEKAKQLSSKLGIEVTPDQVILSHTPLRRLSEQFASKNVLVVGGSSCIAVAKAYGFLCPICPSEYHYTHHSIYPSKSPQSNMGPESQKLLNIDTSGDISAILILGDSNDWGLDIQVMTDALLYNEMAGEKHIPIFACNADIVYTGRHPNPRFTQGAFVHAFKSLFEHYSDMPVDIEFCGKPYPVQYEYAEELFRNIALSNGMHPPSKCFGIGDNPKSDIRGANQAGSHWRSILVRTGVFQGEENDTTDPADFVVQDVLDAVKLVTEILAKEE